MANCSETFDRVESLASDSVGMSGCRAMVWMWTPGCGAESSQNNRCFFLYIGTQENGTITARLE